MSNACSVCVHVCSLQSLVTPWTGACQAPVSMKFPRQEYWSGLVFPSPGDLQDPRIKPTSPALQADSLPLYHLASPMSNNYTFYE